MISIKDICNSAVGLNTALLQIFFFLTVKSLKAFVQNSQIFHWESKNMYI